MNKICKVRTVHTYLFTIQDDSWRNKTYNSRCCILSWKFKIWTQHIVNASFINKHCFSKRSEGTLDWSWLKTSKQLWTARSPRKDIWYFYKTRTCITYLEDNEIRMVLKIPLTDTRQEYEVYKVHNLHYLCIVYFPFRLIYYWNIV